MSIALQVAEWVAWEQVHSAMVEALQREARSGQRLFSRVRFDQ